MPDQYDSLSKNQLASLLRKRDASKKLGLAWERDEIEADAAIDANFVACTIDPALSDGAASSRASIVGVRESNTVKFTAFGTLIRSRSTQ